MTKMMNEKEAPAVHPSAAAEAQPAPAPAVQPSAQPFKAVSRIVLNNWHYIDHKVLELNKSINFFTGHSGSGKSTVIDALQIVLYANTDGRGFFNKAAADDSDRSLIEYLRGMINIGENNQASYKRNRNFSTTIVLELEQTGSGEKECVGVLFDVETSTNEISRLFFWHRGAVPEHFYRVGGQLGLSAEDGGKMRVKESTGAARAMTIPELRDYLRRNYAREDFFLTSNNERFRRNLYDVYLGGLDMEKFPRLFKRAIPFRMNIRLEDFVKEYICMEQDIHIEDMQESVVLYGRMRTRIENTAREIEELTRICDAYRRVCDFRSRSGSLRCRMEKLQLLALEEQIRQLRSRAQQGREDLEQQRKELERLLVNREEYGTQYEEINRQLLGSGYGELEAKRKDLKENLELLSRSQRKWEQLSNRLQEWEEEESISNQTLWDMDKFRKGTITGEELERLKKDLKQVHDETERQRQEASSEARALRKEAELIQKDLSELLLGRKAYPREVEEARTRIQAQLYERTGKNVPVRILSDLLDIRDEKWRNALEGYLSWNKLSLIVEPAYVQQAMEIYEELDGKKFWRIALVDTEKLDQKEYDAQPGALSEEVECRERYVRNLVNFLLGNVMKCEEREELRRCRIGVTADCLIYQNFQLRRLNPDNYTRRAFIGEKSMRRRQKELQERLEKLQKRQAEYEESAARARRLLEYEFLTDTVTSYQELLADREEKKKKEEQLSRLEKQLEQLETGAVETWKEQLRELSGRQKELEGRIDAAKIRIHDQERRIADSERAFVEKNEELLAGQRALASTQEWEKEFADWFAKIPSPRFDSLIRQASADITQAEEALEQERNSLVDLRSEYLKKHPGRDFSASAQDNEDYQSLLTELSCDRITDYQEKAAAQARIAVEHFQEDFIYKIRSAIKEAFLRRDELNRIIRGLNFGKDRYQFKITRSRGADGAYYDMFMDEALEIDPASLTASMDNQMDLFSMDHQSRYGLLMNDLIRIFIPPETANARELEEARLNMEKYADYRTYLSFEMEQIVEGEDRLVIDLSKMIRKNSGGEGQNPLYVALLASFAQAYHINLAGRGSRRPTIRLVVLDEAFSKMDAEKVASCIELIRGLGFQAIISATNDKIQNYLENVDKTFVYANPNKKSISIQEFERKDFGRLETEE